MRTVTVEAVRPDGSEVMIKGRWISTTALHPLPDPHAGLRDAVVEAARALRKKRGLPPEHYCEPEQRALVNAVDALNAALAPPDPIAELLAASRVAVVLTGYCHADRERLRAAIVAVEAERRG